METKQDIRKRVLEKRNYLNKQEWEEKSDKIFEKVITHPIFLHAEEIYCYIDFRNEVATRKLIETCWKLKKEFLKAYLPKRRTATDATRSL